MVSTVLAADDDRSHALEATSIGSDHDGDRDHGLIMGMGMGMGGRGGVALWLWASAGRSAVAITASAAGATYAIFCAITRRETGRFASLAKPFGLLIIRKLYVRNRRSARGKSPGTAVLPPVDPVQAISYVEFPEALKAIWARQQSGKLHLHRVFPTLLAPCLAPNTPCLATSPRLRTIPELN
jgi:hypothetical protein